MYPLAILCPTAIQCLIDCLSIVREAITQTLWSTETVAPFKGSYGCCNICHIYLDAVSQGLSYFM